MKTVKFLWEGWSASWKMWEEIFGSVGSPAAWLLVLGVIIVCLGISAVGSLIPSTSTDMPKSAVLAYMPKAEEFCKVKGLFLEVKPGAQALVGTLHGVVSVGNEGNEPRSFNLTSVSDYNGTLTCQPGVDNVSFVVEGDGSLTRK